MRNERDREDGHYYTYSVFFSSSFLFCMIFFPFFLFILFFPFFSSFPSFFQLNTSHVSQPLRLFPSDTTRRYDWIFVRQHIHIQHTDRQNIYTKKRRTSGCGQTTCRMEFFLCVCIYRKKKSEHGLFRWNKFW